MKDLTGLSKQNFWIFADLKNLLQTRNYAEVCTWKYNNERQHSSLMYLTPWDFLLKYGKIKKQNKENLPTFQQNLQTSTIKIST
ncbi:hypothetical protein [Flavobacterium sp. B17]|uniref:hypothetical protein n=1 Tax=Flavobacterium sp. B17 TaxID=95618 RepID=UPI00034608B0|nr:hypothetical protein [Flavobacterium sp. B17]